jgi:hypothetical protein
MMMIDDNNAGENYYFCEKIRLYVLSENLNGHESIPRARRRPYLNQHTISPSL